MPKAPVRPAEYARLRGVTRQSVAKAIKTGRLEGAVNDDGLIDVDLADKLWAANTNPDQGYHGHVKTRAARSGAQSDDGVDLDELRELAQQVGIDPNNVPTLAQSKTLEAAYKAKLAQLDYEERSARLIDMEQVKKQAFKLARLTRDAMLAIPDRVSAEIAGITDPFEIHKRISTEIRMAIAEISKVVDDGE